MIKFFIRLARTLRKKLMHCSKDLYLKTEDYFDAPDHSYTSYLAKHYESQRDFLITCYDLEIIAQMVSQETLCKRIKFLAMHYRYFRCEDCFFSWPISSFNVIKPSLLGEKLKKFYVVEPLPMMSLVDYSTKFPVTRDNLMKMLPNLLMTLSQLQNENFPYLSLNPFSIIVDEVFWLRPPSLNPRASPKSVHPPVPERYRSSFRSVNEAQFYYPPELKTSSNFLPVNCRADSWALGTILGELLVFGGPMFGSFNDIDQKLKTQMILGPAPPQFNWVPAKKVQPIDLPEIIKSLLRYNPNDRICICTHHAREVLDYVRTAGVFGEDSNHTYEEEEISERENSNINDTFDANSRPRNVFMKSPIAVVDKTNPVHSSHSRNNQTPSYAATSEDITPLAKGKSTKISSNIVQDETRDLKKESHTYRPKYSPGFSLDTYHKTGVVSGLDGAPLTTKSSPQKYVTSTPMVRDEDFYLTNKNNIEIQDAKSETSEVDRTQIYSESEAEPTNSVDNLIQELNARSKVLLNKNTTEHTSHESHSANEQHAASLEHSNNQDMNIDIIFSARASIKHSNGSQFSSSKQDVKQSTRSDSPNDRLEKSKSSRNESVDERSGRNISEKGLSPYTKSSRGHSSRSVSPVTKSGNSQLGKNEIPESRQSHENSMKSDNNQYVNQEENHVSSGNFTPGNSFSNQVHNMSNLNSMITSTIHNSLQDMSSGNGAQTPRARPSQRSSDDNKSSGSNGSRRGHKKSVVKSPPQIITDGDVSYGSGTGLSASNGSRRDFHYSSKGSPMPFGGSGPSKGKVHSVDDASEYSILSYTAESTSDEASKSVHSNGSKKSFVEEDALETDSPMKKLFSITSTPLSERSPRSKAPAISVFGSKRILKNHVKSKSPTSKGTNLYSYSSEEAVREIEDLKQRISHLETCVTNSTGKRVEYAIDSDSSHGETEEVLKEIQAIHRKLNDFDRNLISDCSQVSVVSQVDSGLHAEENQLRSQVESMSSN